MLLALVAVLAGLVVLTKAADIFVESAARLSAALKVPPVIIGAAVIGFGTSAPEMVVSGIAAGQGKLDIAVGNVIGSNAANLSLVLGIASLLCFMGVSSSVLRREAPLSTAAVVLFGLLVQGGLERWEGVVLVLALVGALVWLFTGNQRGDEELVAEIEEFVEEEGAISARTEALRALLGLVGVIAGAQLAVQGASSIAGELGLGEGFIAVTLIAVGTSLPELVTAIAAARKGEDELIIGNLLGSNLFNSLAVGGVAALIGPGVLDDPNLASVGVTAMVAVALAAWLFMATARRIAGWEAATLLGAYAVTVPLLA
ncbi:MAG TPA: calcium/sodium antiporter [Acidimicrobiales bacterium]|nr:calcium/sodium antiporter [Acidimicrobiales bacterium]